MKSYLLCLLLLMNGCRASEALRSPPIFLGANIYYVCEEVVAIVLIGMKGGLPMVVTVSDPERMKETLKEVIALKDAGGPVHLIELKKGCKHT